MALVAVIAAAVCLLAPAPASAAVRSGTISFEAPTNPPSFDPQVPATQQRPAVDTFTVAYDDVTGAVAATMRLYEPVFWGSRTPGVSFSLDTECSQDEDDNVRSSDAPLLVGTFGPGHPASAEEPGDPPYAEIKRAGYEGVARGTFAFDGTTSRASVTNPQLRGLDVRCFELTGTEGRPYLQGDWLRSDGHSLGPLTLTRTVAERAFVAELRERYRASFSDAGRRYVKCSTAVWTDEDDGAQRTECMAQFGTGRAWRYVSAVAEVAAGDFEATMGRPFTRRWTRRWRRNSAACTRSWDVQGTLYSNDGACAAALAAHYYRGRTYTGGTGTAAFPQITQYRCQRRRGGVIECTNALGDALRWKR